MRWFAVPGLSAALCLCLSGCGFVGSGRAGANKPSAFVLRGYVSVAGATVAPPGTPCSTAAPGIHAGGPVRVADPDGHTLAAGELTGGVTAAVGGQHRCNFAFEVRGVPGGPDRYTVAVGDQPPATFDAAALRQDGQAVIRVG